MEEHFLHSLPPTVAWPWQSGHQATQAQARVFSALLHFLPMPGSFSGSCFFLSLLCGFLSALLFPGLHNCQSHCAFQAWECGTTAVGLSPLLYEVISPSFRLKIASKLYLKFSTYGRWQSLLWPFSLHVLSPPGTQQPCLLTVQTLALVVHTYKYTPKHTPHTYGWTYPHTHNTHIAFSLRTLPFHSFE